MGRPCGKTFSLGIVFLKVGPDLLQDLFEIKLAALVLDLVVLIKKQFQQFFLGHHLGVRLLTVCHMARIYPTVNK